MSLKPKRNYSNRSHSLFLVYKKLRTEEIKNIITKLQIANNNKRAKGNIQASIYPQLHK